MNFEYESLIIVYELLKFYQKMSLNQFMSVGFSRNVSCRMWFSVILLKSLFNVSFWTSTSKRCHLFTGTAWIEVSKRFLLLIIFSCTSIDRFNLWWTQIFREITNSTGLLNNSVHFGELNNFIAQNALSKTDFHELHFTDIRATLGATI